jgi:phosphoglycerol transferase
MRVSRQEAAYALVTVAATSVLAALVLHLWSATLGVPFAPGGDGYQTLMQVKGVLDNGWILTNPHLGAPFGQQLYDYQASREVLHVVAIKGLGLFSSNPAGVLNAYFLLSFPLVGLAAFVVMRWLGISRPVAAAMSVVYALAPFHFQHQTFLFAYWAAPLGAYLILGIYSRTPLIRGRSRRTALTVGVCAVVALSSFYFAGFTVLLVVIAAAITALASRKARPLLEGGAIVAAILVIGLVASTPDLVYRVEHGRNAVVGKRGAFESELYSTNVLQLVMPVPRHRIGVLARAHDRWASTSPVDKEETNLGSLGALGFVWLLLVMLTTALGGGRKIVQDARQRYLAVASTTALLLGTTGGLSAVFAYAITPQLRSWARITVFIEFFALAAIGLLLDVGYARLRARRPAVPGGLVAAVLVGICAIAVFEQTSPAFVPDYDRNAAAWASDASFGREIERTLGPGGMVFQVPYVAFPETPPVHLTGTYDHVRPYLQTHTLRWSFGSMRARPEDWQAELAGAQPDRLIAAISAAGFDAIYVDRAGYADGGRQLETDVSRITGATPRVSPDTRFSLFDLRGYAAAQRRRTPASELRALAYATLHPVRTDWRDAFSEPKDSSTDAARWAVVPDAPIKVTNPSNQPRTAAVSARLARPGGSAASVVIAYPDGTHDSITVPPEGIDLRRTVRFPAGTSVIRLTLRGAPIAVSSEVHAGFVEVRDWSIGPPGA